MKKRKAKRLKIPAQVVNNNIDEAMKEQESLREMALLNLIVDIIVKATFRDLENGKV